MPLDHFHPAVSAWFTQAFERPTPPQAEAWPAIRAGRHTLIAAPTGSGKTLAAFLAAIDSLVQQGLAGGLADETQVVYVSPLKALSNDIERNLQIPLAGIRDQLLESGLPDVDIRVMVRTGDTTPGERTSMRKRPPHILVTTPESLYLLLTSDSGRAMLGSTRTVIVDEIHAVAGSKRGSHLSLSLERLASLCSSPITRIGLSATQKPIEDIAQFLVGSDQLDGLGKPACAIIDSGHVRERDLALELPGAPLEAVMSAEVWEQVYDRLAQLIQAHRTTLIFVNTRRLAERATRHLSERIGKEHITSHHGSLAKEQRFDAEQKLKAGELRALVATASLELGIDIGDVDLVCQLGSPRSIAALLQRVGRSGHAVGATPKGRLFPLSRDELVESAALLDAVRRGELDRLVIPNKPLDVLAQQIVAELGARDWGEDDLFNMVRRATPYRDLAREEFNAVVRMLSDGFATRRGRRSAYLHRDAVNRQLRGRKGARLTALTCGGAIPDNADYRVILEPTETFIGTLNEDFAIESMPGEIFQLGNMSYKIRKIEAGQVRVEDAKGQPPTIPFWFGEAPGRSDELSLAVSRLRGHMDELLGHVSFENMEKATDWLMHELLLPRPAAEQLTEYLAAAKGVLGALPSQEKIIFERFFDESGGMQFIVHSAFGSRLNRAWGLSLRKRFCRKFNFELQAAATEDAIVLSLGETHSFELKEVARYLNSNTVREVLIQALLAAPLFITRWRWVCTISLAIKRFRGGRKNPPPLQRMDAEDLIATVFPDQIACAENISGNREVPDHPLVNQTIQDCLYEAMDVEGLIALLRSMEAGEKEILTRDLPHPSPLAQEILNARPYAFLDDAPLEERRTQAVISRRWLDPATAADFGKLNPEAINKVREEAWPTVENADELHDALMMLGCVTEAEGERSGWTYYMESLVGAQRATRLTPHPSPLPEGEGIIAGALPEKEGIKAEAISQGEREKEGSLWVAAEQLPLLRALYSEASVDPEIETPTEYAAWIWDKDEALVELLRGRLQGLGPVTESELDNTLMGSLRLTHPTLPSEEEHEVGWVKAQSAGPNNDTEINTALIKLEREGFVMRGQFTPESTELEWCERRLLARIHRYTVQQLRAEIEPVAASDFLRFLFDWHGLTSDPRPEGPQALAKIIEQLEGYEAAAVAWEGDILPARLQDYDPDWLDSLCLSGRALWARLTPPKPSGDKDRTAGPVRSTPISIVTRRNMPEFQALVNNRHENGQKLAPRTQTVADYLAERGASFFDDIVHGTGLLKTQVEDALSELVAWGMVNADGFSGLRALLVPSERRRSFSGGRRKRRTALYGIEDAGRWTLLRNVGWVKAQSAGPNEENTSAGPLRLTRPTSVLNLELIENIARMLLKRYGVVFKRMLEREADWLPPWYELLRVYRKLEARGEIRGGRFVGGFSGEQYALPEAVGALRAIRRKPKNETLVSLSASDPLNLVGILTPGNRVPAFANNRVLYRDGVPIAIQLGKEAKFLEPLEPGVEWEARNALLRKAITPALRTYIN